MIKIISAIVFGVVMVGVALILFYPTKVTEFKVTEEVKIVEAKIPIVITTTNPTVTDYQLPPIEDGMAPVITNIPTKKNVVFLTIDDGTFKDKSVVDILATNHIKASLFLTKGSISNEPEFFKQLEEQGSIVENHTLSHNTKMSKIMPYNSQKVEICGMSDYIVEQYGQRPFLYRPPGGAYSNIMREAAADCGMKAVVIWTATVDKGVMHYQVGETLRPGDIVLMHFRPQFKKDINAFLKAATAAGLQTELLEDYIQNN